jgi:hypothetical protein
MTGRRRDPAPLRGCDDALTWHLGRRIGIMLDAKLSRRKYQYTRAITRAACRSIM